MNKFLVFTLVIFVQSLGFAMTNAKKFELKLGEPGSRLMADGHAPNGAPCKLDVTYIGLSTDDKEGFGLDGVLRLGFHNGQVGTNAWGTAFFDSKENTDDTILLVQNFTHSTAKSRVLITFGDNGDPIYAKSKFTKFLKETKVIECKIEKYNYLPR
ncbi:hypothetical protein DOM22_11640 [Bdellovibrio sp. ZAP7]|uniref:hypothetical protein n=1 Tax=Bdellovibrio sp. ZAP7 TaxID=2231053 RepID=UPI001158D25F|nr:hypothetical protein [Bdellovibrio sp. ZAP7]QDK45751.1 hypothetical protein DOM22_11640 [Bdellovibrio sp. ZAP7]